MPKTLSLSEAAKLAATAPSTVRMWILTGRLKAERLERGFAIDEEDFEKVLAERLQHSTQIHKTRGSFEPVKVANED